MNNWSKQRRRVLSGLAATTAAGIALPNTLPGIISNSYAQDSESQADSKAESQPLDRYGIRTAQAPEIELDYWIDANGKPTSFSVNEQHGKWLFMKFWQSWCPGCHKLGFPTLQKFTTAFRDNPKVEMIAVQTVFEGKSVNTVEAVREQQLRYELPIVMGHDAGNEDIHHPLTMVNYRTGGTPWLVLVAPDGTVVFNDFHVDADALIEFVAEQVS